MARLADRVRWWPLLLLVSCTQDTHYRIEMKTEGEAMVRSLSSWTMDEAGNEVAAAPRVEGVDLAALYENLDDLEYSASFRGALPEDFGGAGLYLSWPTTLGTAHLYSERVRGGLDVWELFETIEEASDRATDLLLGWLQFEFGTEEWHGDLHARIDGALRRDLKNFALYVRMAEARDDDEVSRNTWGCLALQYAVEKGYAHPSDLPRAYRVVEELADDLGDATPYAVFHALLPSDTTLPGGLRELLSRPKVALASFQSWYRDHVAETELDESSVPLTPFDGYAMLLIEWNLFGSQDLLEMELKTGAEPFLTNGEWDEEAGCVRWSSVSIEADRVPATYRIAMWVDPDADAQLTHLGRVAVTDGDLWEYAMWRHALTPDEGRQWDRVLDTLAADPHARAHPEELPFGETGTILEAEARKLLTPE